MGGIVFLFYFETKDKHLEERDIVEGRQLFIHQGLEYRRKTYNTFIEERVNDPRQDSINFIDSNQ